MSPNTLQLSHDLISLAGTIIVGLIGIVINRYVKDNTARTVLSLALDRASGLMLAHGQAVGDQFLQNTVNRHNALMLALNYVSDVAEREKAHFGLSSTAIAEKITAVLATKLALATPIPTPTPDPAVPAAPDAALGLSPKAEPAKEPEHVKEPEHAVIVTQEPMPAHE